METTLTQWAEMTVALCAGLLTGLWYDGLSMVRMRPHFWLDCLLDLIFWAGAFAVAAFALYLANGLKVRLYLLVCLAGGFGAWRFAVSPLLMGAYAALCRGIGGILRFLGKMMG